MRPPSIHSNFFSSLKQVEKRLKLDNQSHPSTPIPPSPETTQIESLSSPMFINSVQPTTINSSSVQESEAPSQFLSNSTDFPETHQNPSPEDQDPPESSRLDLNGVDEIEMLIRVLGLSGSEEGETGSGLKEKLSGVDDSWFYGKIVGVKGPKCGKEVERLEGWIKHFMKGKREPLRLAHLLLGKSIFLSEDSDGLGGLGFPSTIEEFLENDPPED